MQPLRRSSSQRPKLPALLAGRQALSSCPLCRRAAFFPFTNVCLHLASSIVRAKIRAAAPKNHFLRACISTTADAMKLTLSQTLTTEFVYRCVKESAPLRLWSLLTACTLPQFQEIAISIASSSSASAVAFHECTSERDSSTLLSSFSDCTASRSRRPSAPSGLTVNFCSRPPAAAAPQPQLAGRHVAVRARQPHAVGVLHHIRHRRSGASRARRGHQHNTAGRPSRRHAVAAVAPVLTSECCMVLLLSSYIVCQEDTSHTTMGVSVLFFVLSVFLLLNSVLYYRAFMQEQEEDEFARKLNAHSPDSSHSDNGSSDGGGGGDGVGAGEVDVTVGAAAALDSTADGSSSGSGDGAEGAGGPGTGTGSVHLAPSDSSDGERASPTLPRKWTFYLNTEAGWAYFLNIRTLLTRQAPRERGHAESESAQLSEWRSLLLLMSSCCSVIVHFDCSWFIGLLDFLSDLAVPDCSGGVHGPRDGQGLVVAGRVQHGHLHLRRHALLEGLGPRHGRVQTSAQRILLSDSPIHRTTRRTAPHRACELTYSTALPHVAILTSLQRWHSLIASRGERLFISHSRLFHRCSLLSFQGPTSVTF